MTIPALEKTRQFAGDIGRLREILIRIHHLVLVAGDG